MPNGFWQPKCALDWVSNFLKSKFWKLFQIFFDKMVSILINIIQHEQYFFSFQAHVLLSSHSSQSHATLCSSLMSNHQVNNKCNRVKGRHWRWLIYTLRNFYSIITSHIFGSNHHSSWKFHKFHRKTPVLESLFSLKWLNYI